MDIKFDTKKSSEKLSNLWQKAADVSKNAAEGVQKGAVALSEKVKEDSYQYRLKKYNPLFADVYSGTDFVLPHIIVIVDAIVRQGIDVCEGAIGWSNREGDVEVLYLYEESLGMKDIQFYPNATRDGVYYEDNYNPNRYIRVDCIFNKAHEERLAELKNVAHMLGAKRCTIEITETSHQVTSNNCAIGFGKKVGGFSASAENISSQSRAGKITAEFEGCITPHKPKLKWFANDENIKKLIDMRCKGVNVLKSETLELFGSSSATMSQKAAASIDAVVSKLGLKGFNISMQSQALVEHTSKLIFSVEF